MWKLIKAGIVLALLAAIFGGIYGAYYYLVLFPKNLDAQALAANGPPGQPTPDPSTPDFEKAMELKHDRKTDEARDAFEDFLARFPDSSHRDEAESMLGELNLANLFSGLPGPGKFEYVVEKGDVLDRVAHKTHSNPELIFQANNLERVNLQIGQRLEIPKVDFAVQVHLASKNLLLLNGGRFFKAYPILDAHPLPKKTAQIHTKVQEKLAFTNAHRVVFGSKEYANSLRSLSLAGQPGFTIYGESDDAANRPPGSGIGLSASDAEEVHALVSIGTPVTISGD
jgi:LysM repeat protein